jgi:hypothetical protein
MKAKAMKELKSWSRYFQLEKVKKALKEINENKRNESEFNGLVEKY